MLNIHIKWLNIHITGDTNVVQDEPTFLVSYVPAYLLFVDKTPVKADSTITIPDEKKYVNSDMQTPDKDQQPVLISTPSKLSLYKFTCLV